MSKVEECTTERSTESNTRSKTSGRPTTAPTGTSPALSASETQASAEMDAAPTTLVPRAGKPLPVAELPTLADALGGGIGLDNRYTFAMVRDLVDFKRELVKDRFFRSSSTPICIS